MHFGRPLLCALAVALFLGVQLVACRDLENLRRQGDVRLSPRAIGAGEASGPTEDLQSTTKPKPRTTPEPTPTKSTANPAATSAAAAFETGAAETDDLDEPTRQVYTGGLPIAPKVTPGIGVAGMVLLLAGLCCNLVGIKIKRLHIFLSTAFLTGLSVTVLVVYVMNPPVGDAIQGAYVAAAIITGSAIGGLAVVFPEVTEGLGCLLGGFCLSMWFLVLKPGGLVTSVYGKLIVIGAFCFAVFALAFHRATRPWGLIGSLSFAGSTSIVLGIDCFSRAGLKEFWLYIWALNDRMFPLGTDTYPHTRGMKVEIAAIFVMFSIGVMSQMKLWKILQERREVKNVLRRQHAADLEAVDEETGRRVEAEYRAEKGEWEAAYGNKGKSEEGRPATGRSKADSGLGDEEIKESGETVQKFVETDEMKEAREEHIQMGEMSGSQAQSTLPPPPSPPTEPKAEGQPRGEIVIPVGFDEVPILKEDNLHPPENISPASRRNSAEAGSQGKSSQGTEVSPGDSTQSGNGMRSEEAEKPTVTPAPVVVPLPLPIPREDDGDGEDGEGSSVATRADSDHFSVIMEESEAPEGHPTEYNRVSRASSLAATCDHRLDEDEKDLPEFFNSPVASRIDLTKEGNCVVDTLGVDVQVVEPETDAGMQPAGSADEKAVVDDSKDTISNGSLEALDTNEKSEISTLNSTPPPLEITKIEPEVKGPPLLPQDLVPASYPKSKSSSSVSRKSNFEIQTQCSKVVKTYRCNEWAKHLSQAEKPELDELPVAQEAAESAEKPAPLDIQELQETAAVPKPIARKASKGSIYNVSQPPAVVTSSTRAILRSSIVPLPSYSTEVEQPSVSFAVGKSVTPLVDRATSAAAGMRSDDRFSKQQGTLLGQRESMVRNRSSLNVLERYDSSQSPTPVFRSSPDPHRSASAMGFGNIPMQNIVSSRTPQPRQSSQMLSDDMPLADRQHILHQSMSQQSLGHRSWSLNHPPVMSQRRTTPTQPYPPDKRSEILYNWRDVVRAQQMHDITNLPDQRRAAMIDERNQAAMMERQKAMQGNLRDERMDEMMRRGDMLDLHKEALHKMQAEAVRRAS